MNVFSGQDSDKTPPPAGEATVIQSDSATLNAELQRAKEQEACLIIIRGSPQGHRFFITQSEMSIGRDPTADISVSDQSISRKHAKISRLKNEIILTDLGSSNGTFVNGTKVNSGESVPLSKEDMITLGNSILKFLPAGELEILFYGNLGLAAHTDALTKVYNKGYLMEALEAEFKRAKALQTDFSIIFFDLDHFKKINDQYGHDAGDYVLKECTQLIRSYYVRPKDIFARYGGEEFVLLLFDTHQKSAAELAEKIRSAIETHAFIYEGKRLPVTSSFGVSEMKLSIESSQTLIKQADQALYHAKMNGRNRVTASS